MQLPKKFLKSVMALITPLLDGRGSTPLETILELVGKCSRIAQIVPTARPFAQGMWAAYTAAAKADAEGIRESRFKHHTANRRFTLAARWIKQLIQPGAEVLFPLRSYVPARPDPVPTTAGTTIQFDASPWGGGAVLRKNMVIVEYWSCVWDAKSVAHLGVAIGKAKFQTFWEYLTALLALLTWGGYAATEHILLVGDNTASLQDALDFKGKGCLLAVARELALNTAQNFWRFSVGHLAAEYNGVPDALSRLEAPLQAKKKFPTLELANAVKRTAPAWGDVWSMKHTLSR